MGSCRRRPPTTSGLLLPRARSSARQRATGWLVSACPTSHPRKSCSMRVERVHCVQVSDVTSFPAMAAFPACHSTMQSPPEPASCYKSRGNAGQRTSELNAKLGARGDFTPSKRCVSQHPYEAVMPVSSPRQPHDSPGLVHGCRSLSVCAAVAAALAVTSRSWRTTTST